MRDPARTKFYPPPAVYRQPGRRSKCVRCRYPLNGLDGGRRCPECGLPIADSLRSAQPPPPPLSERFNRVFVLIVLFWAAILTAVVAVGLRALIQL